MNRILLSLWLASLLILSGCGESATPKSDAQQSSNSQANTSPETAASGDGKTFGDKFPEVLAVDAEFAEGKGWRFNVTLSSAYDTPKRYADAWRVLDDQGNQLGIRVLGHDHASEQPFTRSATIQIPADMGVVFVEGRDQENGWSGQRFEFKLPASQ